MKIMNNGIDIHPDKQMNKYELMESVIVPSELRGNVKAPPSKSMTQRAIAAALLADGESIIINPSGCDDSLAAMSIASGLGAAVVTEAQ